MGVSVKKGELEFVWVFEIWELLYDYEEKEMLLQINTIIRPLNSLLLALFII